MMVDLFNRFMVRFLHALLDDLLFSFSVIDGETKVFVTDMLMTGHTLIV